MGHVPAAGGDVGFGDFVVKQGYTQAMPDPTPEKPPGTTKPKPFVFVLMPFDEALDDVYHVGIKAACAAAGAYCERVDEQIFHENILERVYNQIAKADMLVADMTGRNPNVFYEVGYAHALGRRVILLTSDATDIPFDLKHYPHIVYDRSIRKLKAELEQKIQWFIDNPEGRRSGAEDLEFVVGGAPLDEDNTHIMYKPPHGVHFRTLVHNRSSRAISVKLAVITPGCFESSLAMQLPDGRFFHEAHKQESFSGEYFEWGFHCGYTWKSLPQEATRFPATLRVMTGNAMREIPFWIRVPGKSDAD